MWGKGKKAKTPAKRIMEEVLHFTFLIKNGSGRRDKKREIGSRLFEEENWRL